MLREFKWSIVETRVYLGKLFNPKESNITMAISRSDIDFNGHLSMNRKIK